jgi:hypothetical protein
MRVRKVADRTCNGHGEQLAHCPARLATRTKASLVCEHTAARPTEQLVGETFLYGRIVGGNGIALFPECAQKYIDAVRVSKEDRNGREK